MRCKSNLSAGIPVFFILAYCLAVFGLSSCGPSLKDKKIIDLSSHWNKEENYSLSKISHSISYIPLETKEECFIPNAYECSVRVSDNHIFIVPRMKPMMIFDRKGKFLGKVGSIGEGPSEVITISSYVANEKDQWIAIFKPSNSSVLMYSFNGRLIRDFPVDKSIVRLIGDPEGNLIGLSIDIQNKTIGDSRMIYLSPTGQEIRRTEMFSSPDLKSRILMSDALRIRWEKDGLIRVYEAPFDKIYQRNKRGNWETLPGFNPGEIAYIQQIQETADYYFIVAANQGDYFFIASKVTGEVAHCSFAIETKAGPDIPGLMNDLDGGLPIWPRSNNSDKEIVTLFDANTLIDCAKGKLETYGGMAPKVQESFRKMASGLTYEDNPVVAVVTLK